MVLLELFSNSSFREQLKCVKKRGCREKGTDRESDIELRWVKGRDEREERSVGSEGDSDRKKSKKYPEGRVDLRVGREAQEDADECRGVGIWDRTIARSQSRHRPHHWKVLAAAPTKSDVQWCVLEGVATAFPVEGRRDEERHAVTGQLTHCKLETLSVVRRRKTSPLTGQAEIGWQKCRNSRNKKKQREKDEDEKGGEDEEGEKTMEEEGVEKE